MVRLLMSVGLLVTLAWSQPLLALEFSKKGDTVIVSGSVRGGDDAQFRDFMAEPGNATIKIVRLNSTGGMVIAARDMGRIIRAKNMITFVDGKSDNCASACTVIFASGVKRHYANAQGIKDGVYGFKDNPVGLGYHEGNQPLSLSSNKYSGQATADMIAAYYEFGVKDAKDVITLAPPNKLYRISAQTAANLGIATSLSAP
jgi:hypothetical protein